MDPVRRMRIDQFSREAEAFLRGGSPERAIETYKKALELDPADLSIIEAIVAVHRTTGRLTQVQMQYVQSAQALVGLGKKREATRLLDMAEQLFPGSTRIHRRAFGLPEPGSPPASPPRTPFELPTTAPAPSGARPGDLDLPIGLDLPDLQPLSPVSPSAPSDLQPIALGDGLPLLPDLAPPPPDPFAPPPLPPGASPAAQAPAALEASDLNWMDTTLTDYTVAEPPLPTSAPTAPLPPVPTQQLGPEVIEALSTLPEAEPPTVASGPAPAPAAGPAADELESLLGDIDFQLDYGSPEEAKIEIEAALRQFPGNPELELRLERADTALQKLGHTAKAGALKDSDFANSFFDLTDVLGTALMDSGEGEEMHDATHVVEKIQSVEELFSAFREGVEKQVKGDDYDTHYNLGIAYKEMQLIEPAIEEFKVAMRDPERTLECCSMLSICEQARGDLAAAVEWLRQGVLAPGFPPEDSIGLRYDLADIYLQQGHADLAMEEFRAVHEMDPDYRDVAARLA
jgi:tetratricopeptide (TPR) repeat protein